MNDKHSAREWIYRSRWLESRFAQALNNHPIVVLTGARQVGKSTLLRHAHPSASWRYHSLDDLDVVEQAEKDPEALWAGTDRVVIDEAQRVPSLFLAVKRAVDRDRKKRFVLSGSANFRLLLQVSESLAGRAVYFVLRPMTLGEREEEAPPTLVEELLKGQLPSEGERLPFSDPLFHAVNGFMPALLMLSSREAVLEWWQGYVSTYLERDLRGFSQVSSLSDFRRVMELVSLRTGQLVNQTEIARDAGVSQPTVHRYLNLLEASFLLHRIPAYAKSRTKRLVKSPKVYWADPALPVFLMGHYEIEGLREAREAGAIFENLLLIHLQALGDLLLPAARLYYWRTTSGVEVDFVLEWGRKLVAFETKLTRNPRYRDTKGLVAFLTEYPNCGTGVLIHCGEEVLRLGENIVAVPWQLFATSPG